MNQLETIIQSQLEGNKLEKQQLEKIKDEINQNLIKIKDTITKQKFTDENIDVNYKKLIFSAKKKHILQHIKCIRSKNTSI